VIILDWFGDEKKNFLKFRNEKTKLFLKFRKQNNFFPFCFYNQIDLITWAENLVIETRLKLSLKKTPVRLV